MVTAIALPRLWRVVELLAQNACLTWRQRDLALLGSLQPPA
jgi:hypothetical protein